MTWHRNKICMAFNYTRAKARKFVWCVIFALLFLATGQAGAAGVAQVPGTPEMSATTQYGVPGEKWVDETRKTLHKLSEKIGVAEVIKIGSPAYKHIMSLAEPIDPFNIFPELVAKELSKVVEYGGTKLKFDGKGERYAKKTLLKAASYLPTEAVRRVPAVDARTVVGRGLYRQYAPDRALIKTNNVKTSLHELGHALEYSSGHLLRLRKEFYEKRTQGKTLRNLSCFLIPFGYRPDEKYKAGFVDRYMGKENGVEVFSCGVEYVFFNRHDIWHRDPEATKFVLGSLIFYGSRIPALD